MSGFTDRMAAGKLAAQEARNQGFHTGKSAAGWEWKRPDPAKGSFERAVLECKAKLRNHWAQVLADYLHDAHPDRHIPF